MTDVIVCVKKKKHIKVGALLCSYFNIEYGRKHFWHIMLYYFKKGKNASETQKDLYNVWRRQCD